MKKKKSGDPRPSQKNNNSKPTIKRRRTDARPPRSDAGDTNFVTHFRHWRSGEILYASDYGLAAWPIPRKKR